MGVSERPPRVAGIAGRRLAVALLGAPVAWSVHFLLGYLLIALWCTEGWPGLRVAVGVLTLICALAAVGAGLIALRAWRDGQAALRSDAEPGGPVTWDARMGERGALPVFLAMLALFHVALFTYLIVLEGLSVVIGTGCQATSGP